MPCSSNKGHAPERRGATPPSRSYEINTVNGISHGMWSHDESVKSSTWRELKAVYRVMCSLLQLLSNHTVKWFTDNQAVCSVVHKGSMKTELQDTAIDIFRICMFLFSYKLNGFLGQKMKRPIIFPE